MLIAHNQSGQPIEVCVPACRPAGLPACVCLTCLSPSPRSPPRAASRPLPCLRTCVRHPGRASPWPPPCRGATSPSSCYGRASAARPTWTPSSSGSGECGGPSPSPRAAWPEGAGRETAGGHTGSHFGHRCAPGLRGMLKDVPGPVCHLVTPWSHPGHILATPWSHSGHTLVTPWSHPGHTLVTLWSHSGHTLVTPWSHSGHPLVTPWSHSGHTLVTLWAHPGHTLVTPWSHLAPV